MSDKPSDKDIPGFVMFILAVACLFYAFGFFGTIGLLYFFQEIKEVRK